MALDTRCAFIYGHTVGEDRFLDFNEGAGEVIAELNVGEYSLSDFCTEIARAMNDVSAATYSCSANRSTGVITITKDSGTFKILGATGTSAAANILSLAGFPSVDTGFALLHAGTIRSGFIWEPQFLPQDYVSFDNQQSAIDGTVKKSASGKVEAVKFGNQKIMDINFIWNTNIIQTQNDLIRSDAYGEDNCRAFMVYAVTKADMEFIPDASKPDVFQKVLLESTPESSDGLAFKLKEQYQKGLPGYFDTGILKFRLIN